MSIMTQVVKKSAEIFLNDLPKKYRERYYGQILCPNLDGRFCMSNGNAMYVGCQIPNIPELEQEMTKMFEPLARKCATESIYRDVKDRIVMDINDVRAAIARKQNEDHNAGRSYRRHSVCYMMTTPKGNQIAFDCERMITDYKLLGGKDVTISLPDDANGIARFKGPNGVIFQCPIMIKQKRKEKESAVKGG